MGDEVKTDKLETDNTTISLSRCKADINYFGDKLLNGFKLRPDQLSVINHPAKKKVICAGRRWGKSKMLGLYALWKAVTIPNRKVLVFGPGWDEVQNVLDLCREVLDESPLERSLVSNIKYKLTFSNKSTIIAKVASPLSKGKRGRKADDLLITEAAYIAEECMTAIRPTRLDSSAPEIQESTPLGRNHFHRTYNSKSYQAFHFRTLDNPMIDPKDLEEDREHMTELEWLQEYEAAFLDDAYQVFSTELVDYAFKKNIQFRNSGTATGNFVAGLDLGRTRDRSVLMILEVVGKIFKVRYLEEFMIDPKDPKFWTRVLDKTEQKLKDFNVRKILVDQTGIGDMPALELRNMCIEHGVPTVVEGVNFSYAMKNKFSGLINTLVLKFERKEFITPFNKEFMRQLKSIRFQVTISKVTGQTIQKFAAMGKSPDIVIAAALAVKAAPFFTSGASYSKGNTREDVDVGEKFNDLVNASMTQPMQQTLSDHI